MTWDWDAYSPPLSGKRLPVLNSLTSERWTLLLTAKANAKFLSPLGCFAFRRHLYGAVLDKGRSAVPSGKANKQTGTLPGRFPVFTCIASITISFTPLWWPPLSTPWSPHLSPVHSPSRHHCHHHQHQPTSSKPQPPTNIVKTTTTSITATSTNNHHHRPNPLSSSSPPRPSSWLSVPHHHLHHHHHHRFHQQPSPALRCPDLIILSTLLSLSFSLYRSRFKFHSTSTRCVNPTPSLMHWSCSIGPGFAPARAWAVQCGPVLFLHALKLFD